jgi:hypothetical protein
MTQPNLQVVSNLLKALSKKVTNLPNLQILTIMESLEKTAVMVEQTLKRNDETMSQVCLVSQNFLQILCTCMYIIFGFQYKKSVRCSV